MTKQDMPLVRHRPDTIERIDALLPRLQDSRLTACLGVVTRAAVVRLCTRIGLEHLEAEIATEDVFGGDET